ncbi:MAG: Cenp-O kinetochore centromere component-domain-containing protein, partial [Linnemannia gamsii]
MISFLLYPSWITSVLNMEAKRDTLLRQIEQEEQSIEEDHPSPAPLVSVVADDQEQKRLKNILMAYRLTGVTLFNGDEFDQQDWSQYDVNDILEGPKDAGIRFDTFALGKYFEPYYIMLRTTPKDKGINSHDGEDDQLDNRKSMFEIAKHTIPHWIPLRETEKRYLNRDMSTFTRNVSGYLQSFVARRENVVQVIETFTLSNSLLKAAAEVVTAATADDDTTPNQAHVTLPRISCQTKDAAIRDVVFNCFRYNTLFTLYNRRQVREQKQLVEKATKSATVPGSGFSSTTTTTNISKVLDNHDLDMDIDTDNTVEDSEEQREQKEDMELLGQPETNVSAQIHLIYDDLQSTTPSRADVQFSKGHDLIRLETLSSKDPLRVQHARWTKLLIKSYSLVDAMKSIADLQNI